MNRLSAPDRYPVYPVIEVQRELPYAVDLGARAVALAAIAEYLNYAAEVRGADKSGALYQRYGQSATRVRHGMGKTLHELKVGFDEGVAVLTAEDALRANGVDKSDIELAHTAVQAAINRDMGLNVPHGSVVREKAVKAAERTAESVRHYSDN